MWSIVFISASPPPALAEALPSGEPYVSVFLPCTPNPTTGFWFYLPASEVIEVPLSADAALKLVMSAGVIQPGGASQAQLAALAEESRRAMSAAAAK
jgi:uncharacterized membrane protein